MSAPLLNPDALDATTLAFYRGVMTCFSEAGIPFLVGGGYALRNYTGIVRDTKDFDLFILRRDVPRSLTAATRAGFRTDLRFPHWLGKVLENDRVVDLIFSSGNGLCPVDYAWFVHGVPGRVLDVPSKLCPPEEMIWHRPIYRDPEFTFTPAVVLQPALLAQHLFVRADYHHYYFGDWYDAKYSDRGIEPWFAFRDRSKYEPLYSYYSSSEARRGGDFDESQYNRYRRLRQNPQERPPQTFSEQARRSDSGGPTQLALMLDDLAIDELELNLQPYNRAQRSDAADVMADYRRSEQARARLEDRTRETATRPRPEIPERSIVERDRSAELRRAIARATKERKEESPTPALTEIPTIVAEPREIEPTLPPEVRDVIGDPHLRSPRSSSRQQLTDDAWEEARRSGRPPRQRVEDQDFLPGVPEHLLDTPSESAVPGN